MVVSPAPDLNVLLEIAVRYDEDTGIVHIAGPGFQTTLHADPEHRRGHRHLHSHLFAFIQETGALTPKITARQMADAARINYITFRQALWRAKRRAELPWHQNSAVWEARLGSAEHRDMQRIIAPLIRREQGW